MEQLLIPIFMLGIYWLTGYYNTVFLKSRLQELGNTIAAVAIGVVIFFFVALIDDLPPDRHSAYLSLLVLAGIMFGCVYPVRIVITMSVTRSIRRGQWCRNALIVGTTQKAVDLCRRISDAKEDMGLLPVGFISTDECVDENKEIEGLPVYSIENLSEVCAELNVSFSIRTGLGPR